MNLNVPLDLHNRFKATVSDEGHKMTDVLLEFIKDYGEDHGQMREKKKGKRG